MSFIQKNASKRKLIAALKGGAIGGAGLGAIGGVGLGAIAGGRKRRGK